MNNNTSDHKPTVEETKLLLRIKELEAALKEIANFDTMNYGEYLPADFPHILINTIKDIALCALNKS